MPVVEKTKTTTYMTVPPPPLPEFYLTKKKRHDNASKSSSCSTTKVDEQIYEIKHPPTSGDGAYDGRPMMPQTQSAPFFAVPPPIPPNGVPPLAIYHICRICLRPRSPRYHREHPIPIDGVPPPPGICRRCRVTTVEEIPKDAELVVKSDSNEIKLGCILPFVRDEDIISNDEMRRRKIERYLRSNSKDRQITIERTGPGKDIVYRHVRVIDGSEEDEPRRKKVVFTAQDAIDDFDDDLPPEPPTAPRTMNTSHQARSTKNLTLMTVKPAKSVNIRRLDSTKASVSTQGSSTTSHSGHKSKVQASARVTHLAQSERTDSEIRRIAREEVERYASTVPKPERNEYDIRRLAREEVERYRQAERKLEAHPDPYAHGKLVPVERRIAVERDIAEVKPWSELAKEEVPSVLSSARRKPPVAQSSSVSTEIQNDERNSRSRTGNWGPKWRRELSVERHTRRESGGHMRKGSDQRSRYDRPIKEPTPQQDNGSPVRNNLREVYDAVQESDLPRPSNGRPYVIEIDPPPRPRTTSYRRQEPSNSESIRKDPPVSARVTEQEEESRRAEVRAQASVTSQPAEQPTRTIPSRLSKHTDGGYWPEEATSRTIDIRSAKQNDDSEHVQGHQAPRAVPRSKTEKNTGSYASEQVRRNYSRTSEDEDDREKAVNTSDRTKVRGSVLSEKTYWPKDQDVERPKPATRPQNRNAPSAEGIEASIRPSAPPKGKPYKPKPVEIHRAPEEPDTEYIYTERVVRPADSARDWTSFEERPRTEVVEEEEFWIRRRPEANEAPDKGQRKEQRRTNNRKVRDSDDSNHVRFNSKVDISPTPPGSDASSSAFRSYHSFGRGSSRQVDGPGEAEQGENLSAEYERRGRTRSREPRSRNVYQQAQMHERGRDREETVKPKPEGGVQRRTAGSNTWVPGGRRLDRALSESPSREEVMSESGSRKDGRGPYRVHEEVTESMRTQDGSPDSRARGEGGYSTHSSIGQAAQVRW